MFKSRRFAIACSAVLYTASLQAADFSNEDLEQVRNWLNTKRMVTVNELGGALSISGDVHAEMQSSSETVNGKQMRLNNGTANPPQAYDVELNLSIDYRTDWSWMAGRIRFDNDAGITDKPIGDGTRDKLKVDRAYFGVNLIDDDRHTMMVQVGRNVMQYVFDSKLEFGSNFDGVEFKDSYTFDYMGDLYYKIAAMLVSEKHNQAAYIGEIGFFNIIRTGFNARYTLIDWNTKHRHHLPYQFQFVVSQLNLFYRFVPQLINQSVKFYVAGLYNHRARKHKITNETLANYGGYIGVAIGETKLQGDWTFEGNYQVLAAQCVPDFDANGVGLGNSDNSSFYYERKKIDGEGKKKTVLNDREKAGGNVNYRGFQLTLQYMLTNNLKLFQSWQQSITLDEEIGPFRRYKQYELEFVYIF